MSSDSDSDDRLRCYSRQGNEVVTLTPCSTDGSPSHCCGLENFYCATNGLCVRREDSDEPYPYSIGGCTDPDWPDDICVGQCKNVSYYVRSCDNQENGYSCIENQWGVDCADDSEMLFFTDPVRIIYPSSTVSVESSTRSSPSSSPSATGQAGSLSGADDAGSGKVDSGVAIGVGVGLGVAVLFLIAAVLFLWRGRKRDRAALGEAQAQLQTQRQGYPEMAGSPYSPDQSTVYKHSQYGPHNPELSGSLPQEMPSREGTWSPPDDQSRR